MHVKDRGFSLPEALLVTALTSSMMLCVHKLVSAAYPVQAKKSVEIATVREATVFLDTLIQQCQTARRIIRGDNGQPAQGTVSLASVPLIVTWNRQGSLTHDRYSLQAHTVYQQRFGADYKWNEAATWAPLPGFEAEGKALLDGVQSWNVTRTHERGVELLEFHLQLVDQKRALSARVALQ